MSFKKTTSRLTVVPAKQAQKVLQKAQRRPYTFLIVAALVPLAALLAFTLKGSVSASHPRKAAGTQVIVSGQTPQQIAEEATNALRKGDEEAFFDILDRKVKDPNIVNSRGDSLLLAAATLGNISAVERLLALGADVNKQNAYTRDTAVLRSVYMGHDDITRLLVSYEKADLNLPNNYHQTPMGLAIEKQNGQLVDLFLLNGVKAGVDSDTLLRASAKKNFVGVLGMLKAGVDPNVKNAKGNTPLIISASLGDTRSVQTLLAYRANVNAVNNEGNSALLYAASNNHPQTLLALFAPLTMQYRADVNLQNKRGETALYWAALKGYPSVVKILLAYDADKNLKTATGQTALDAAKRYRRTEIIRLLGMSSEEVKRLFNQAREGQMAVEASQGARQAEAAAEQNQSK